MSKDIAMVIAEENERKHRGERKKESAKARM